MPESFIQPVVEDPLLSNFELGLRRLFYPLGFPLELQTNSREVTDAASEAWGLFSKSFDMEPMRLSLGVREADSEEPLPTISSFMAREHLMTVVMNARNFFTCDFQQAFSFGWITPRLASDHDGLRYHVLTPAAVMMAQHRALATLHAASVARNGCGVVLCGDSFAGKSTLAYACARAGWTYITDDGTFLVRDRADRYAIGNPHFIRFREDARQLFPELGKWLASTRPNGKIGMELPTRDLGISIAPGANIDHVVFLDRNHAGPGPARLRRCPNDRLRDWSERYVTFGSNEVRAAQASCHARLLDAHIWKMSYHNFEDAVRRLEELVDSGG